MKTHIIELQSFDDIHSVSDKLKWVKSDRVLVIFPGSSIEFGSKLDLIRLQRIAQTQNYTLGIVTTIELIRAIAIELNIPVFHNQDESRRKPWHTKKRIKPGLMNRKEKCTNITHDTKDGQRWNYDRNPAWLRITIFTTSLIAILMIAQILVHRAKISIAPTEQIQIIDLTLKASPDATIPDVGGIIPLHTEVIKIKVVGSLPSGEEMQIGVNHSTGTVVIKNISTSDIEIPIESKILIEGEPQFRLITLEKAIIDSDRMSSITLAVQCEPAGEKCNLSSGTGIKFEGSLNNFLVATLESPLSGGKDLRIPYFNNEDLENQRKLLIEDSEVMLRRQLDDSMTDEIIVLDTEFEPTEINDLSTSTLENLASSMNTISLEVVYEVHYVQRKDIREISQIALGAALNVDWENRPGTLFWEKLSEVKKINNEFIFQIRAAQLIHKKIDLLSLTKNTVGKTRKSAIDFLNNNFDLREDPLVEMSKIYVWLPLLPSNIEIGLQ